MPKQTILIAVVITAVVGLALIVIIYRMNNSAATLPGSTTASGALCTGPLSGCVGKMVTITGTKSSLMQQHRGVAKAPYVNTSYLDSPDRDQTVLYTKDALTALAGAKLAVTGQVIKVGGDAKPGSYEAENQLSPEYQILVESWQEIK